MKRILILCSAIAILFAGIIPVSADNSASNGSVAYKQRDDFVWGVNVHNKSYEAYRQDAEVYIKASAQLGVDIIRINVGASSIEDFDYMDYVVKTCDAYGLKKMFVLSLGAASTEEDMAAITSYYEMVAARYDGKSGYGFVEYIQIGNEDDIPILKNKYPSSAPDGSQFSHYYETDLINLQQKWQAALDGIKNSGSAVQSVINFSYYHYAPLRYAYEHGLKFDIVGVDWYSNNSDINQVLEPMMEFFPEHDIFICETNRWSVKADADPVTGKDIDDVTGGWDTLLEYMEVCYSNPRVKGLIYYELMDNPAYVRGIDSIPEDERLNEKNLYSWWTQEAYFGLMYTADDYSGEIVGPKPIYNTIQGLLGGTNNVIKKAVEYEKPNDFTDDDFNFYDPTESQTSTVTPTPTPTPKPTPAPKDNTSSEEETVSVEDTGFTDSKGDIEIKQIVTTVTNRLFPWLWFIVGSAAVLLIGAGVFVVCYLKPAFVTKLFKK